MDSSTEHIVRSIGMKDIDYTYLMVDIPDYSSKIKTECSSNSFDSQYFIGFIIVLFIVIILRLRK